MTGRGLYVFIYNTGIVWVTGAYVSHYVTKIYWPTNLLTTSLYVASLLAPSWTKCQFLFCLYFNNKTQIAEANLHPTNVSK